MENCKLFVQTGFLDIFKWKERISAKINFEIQKEKYWKKNAIEI